MKKFKKDHEFIIDLCSFVVEAKSEDEAYEKAQKIIGNADVRVDQILDEGELE